VRKTLSMLAAFSSLNACDAGAQKPQAGPVATIGSTAVVTEFATGLEHPWGLAFLPDGRALVTEKPGRLRIVGTDGSLSAPLGGVPEVATESQGGLLDVALDPKFAENRLVYLSFSEPGETGNVSGTAVLRARLGNTALENVQVIYRQVPKVQSGHHYGSRLVFGRDGTLFITQGDRYNQRPKVQDLSSTIGKVVRINTDGSIPKDNPFVGQAGAREEIWSLGHRNAQGATLHPETGQLWTVEHGAQGGDELNHPEKGKNYGWPVITYGVDYSGAKIGEGTAKAGLEQPVHYWDPSIAPSGLIVYTGDAFPQWKGDFLLGSLKFGLLVRLDVADDKVVKEERFLDGLKRRIRDVAQGPDGLIYLLWDDDKGGILRVAPR
jgi:glucose/arabinose dehydrogenase